MFRSAYLQEESDVLGSRIRVVLAMPMVWFLMNFISALRAITFKHANQQPLAYGALLFVLTGQTIYWSMLSWGVFWLLDRWPERRTIRSVLIIALVLITCALMIILFDSFLFSRGGFSPKPPLELFLDLLPRDFHGTMTLIVTVFAAGIAMRYRYAAEQRRLRELTLETQLLQSQIQRVSAQFQPHFLFNTLNAITATLHKDVAMAEKMLIDLGDLLRLALSFSRDEFGTLDEELYFIERYLFLQHMRLGNRLRVSIEAEANAREILFPRFILQPLIENAVKHGIGVSEDGGEINLRARVMDARLQIEIHNTVPQEAQWNADGIGLSCVKQRLALLFAAHHELHVDRSADSVTVAISLPVDTTALPPTVRDARGT